MKTCIIYNPSAGSSSRIQGLRKDLADVSLLEARDADDAQGLAANAWHEGFELVIAAGGDGTINHIVNGIMSRRNRPILAVLPLGTGNDLARTLGIPLDDLSQAVAAIRKPRIHAIDLIHMKMGNARPRWCINVAAGGFTGQMNEIMTDDLKQTWGPLAYLRGAMKVLPDMTHYRTGIRYDSGRGQRISAMNVIVANGRTAGGGTEVAPAAHPEDGLLDVVIVHSGTKLKLTGVAARLIAGNYLNSEIVSHHRVRRVAIRSTPGMWFNVDGELIGNDPAVFEVRPKAIRVIVGPAYRSLAQSVKLAKKAAIT